MSIDELRKFMDSCRSVREENPSDVVNTTPSCCDPISCGYPVGDPLRRARMKKEWDEYRRGWSGL